MKKRSKPDTSEPPAKTEERSLEPYQEVMRGFEHAMHDMERRMDKVLREAFDQGLEWNDLDLFHGLSLQPSAEGHALFEPFGTIGETLDAMREGWRRPFLNWRVEDNELVLRAETPGIPKDEIDIEVTAEAVHIEADAKGHRYRARCRPGVELDPDHAEADYKDGVLEVRVKVVKEASSKARKLQV